jgi:hypothetical protein
MLATSQYAQIAGTSAEGASLSVWVIAGSKGWDKAKQLERSHAFLLMPHGEDPEDFDWQLLVGHEPINVLVEGYITQQELHALAKAMNSQGVGRVYTPNPDGSADCHYTRQGQEQLREIE